MYRLYLFRFSPILIFLLILVVINFFSKDSLNTVQLIGAISSSLITAIGWGFSLYLNHSTFQRGEIIKNKDKLVSLLEKLFEDLLELVSKRETKEEDIENLITDKVVEIELKAKQIQRVFNKNIFFLSDEMIMKLKSEPIDSFEKDYQYIRHSLIKLKKETLEHIDLNYENWLKTL